MSAPDWRFWLCSAADMAQIAELDVYSKRLLLQHNAPGTFDGWVHLLDPKATSIVTHQTAIRADRNGATRWSGPIYKLNESVSASEGSGSDQCQITAMGWLQQLQARLVHTGSEFQTMLSGSNGRAWQAQNGPYTPLGADSATEIAYSVSQSPRTTDAEIIFDLLARANIDAPTGITRGNIYGTPAQRNLTVQRFQSVGQQITQLVNVEDGCDVWVDPVTRRMHCYGNGASSSATIRSGKGSDRGPGCLFSLPGNCVSATRSFDGAQTANRLEAVGQLGVGRADAFGSQQVNGLYETTESLSDVVDTNILIAFANVEVLVRQNPWSIVSLTPRGVSVDDTASGTASPLPRLYDDFDIGDVVYCRVDRGRMQIGTDTVPQATRVFGATVSIDDANAVERLSSIQTTYQGLS